MQRALCWLCAACGIATKAFGLLLQPRPWTGLVSLGLRADRVLQGRDGDLELPQEWWINGAHSWSQERYWEKTLGQAGPDSAKGWAPALLRERGQMGMLWVLVRSQGCSAGTGPSGPTVPELG